MAPMPAVSVVLVTYFGDDNLARLYDSLRVLDYPRERVSLLVVDNGPARAARAWFAVHAPEVPVVVPAVNAGYAGGNALGMEAAIARGADYVAIVTQDTWLDRGWLRALVDVAERHPWAGAVQPKILRPDADGGVVIHTWGNELHFLGVGYVGGDGEPDRALAVREVAYASGAGVLYRVRALADVGVFDPALFMYHEDSDLAWRLRLAGWSVLLAPDAVMYHAYDYQRSGAKFYYVERNRLTNLLTHYRLGTLALIAPAAILFEFAVLAYAVAGGWAGARLAVYRFFLRAQTWRYLAHKRAAVQSVRRVSDRAVVAHFTGRIDFRRLRQPAVRFGLNPILAGYWRLIRPLIVW